MKTLLGHLKSGEPVYDRPQSHMQESIKRLVPYILSLISSGKRSYFTVEMNFDQIIGETICMVTWPGDEIVVAMRPNRVGYARFVKNQEPELCSKGVVALMRGASNSYVLITAYIGCIEEPNLLGWKFWDWHALIWGQTEVISGTEIAIHPLHPMEYCIKSKVIQ